MSDASDAQLTASITLLTFDPVARMAYIYAGKPTERKPVATTLSARAMIGDDFDAQIIDIRKDYDASNCLLGIEFEADDAAEALRRAADIHANHV